MNCVWVSIAQICLHRYYLLKRKSKAWLTSLEVGSYKGDELNEMLPNTGM